MEAADIRTKSCSLESRLGVSLELVAGSSPAGGGGPSGSPGASMGGARTPAPPLPGPSAAAPAPGRGPADAREAGGDCSAVPGIPIACPQLLAASPGGGAGPFFLFKDTGYYHTPPSGICCTFSFSFIGARSTTEPRRPCWTLFKSGLFYTMGKWCSDIITEARD